MKQMYEFNKVNFLQFKNIVYKNTSKNFIF